MIAALPLPEIVRVRRDAVVADLDRVDTTLQSIEGPDALVKRLQPIVHMEVTVPEAHVGTITCDLSGKRGRIQGTDIIAGGMAVVKAQAPLSEVMQYQSQLKSVTGGQGSFAMELSHYVPVPPQVQQQIASQYKPKAEEE